MRMHGPQEKEESGVAQAAPLFLNKRARLTAASGKESPVRRR